MQLQRTLQPAITALKVSTRPWPTIACLAGTDLFMLSVAGYTSVMVRLWLNGQYEPELYWQLWPILGLFLLAYATVGLYPGIGMSPVEELRRTTLTTTLTYLALAAIVFLFREGEVYSRGVFLMVWPLSILLVLIGRVILRHVLAQHGWWGYPVMVLGAGKTGEMVVRTLKRNPSLGLKPILILDDDPDKQRSVEGVPVVGGLSLAPSLARRLQIPYAIVAMPGVPRYRLLELLERYGQTFAHLFIIPDLFGFSSLWVAAKDLGGVLGLEVRQQLLLPGPRVTKFLLEFVLTVCLGLLVLPLIVLITLLIKIDSPGPILYGQTRIGRDGQYFKAWKFRTMQQNADQILAHYLELHPELKTSWEQDHKLKDDPRITRIGKILRRTSLDELPQLWNVLRGEMSMVGPRPIVDEEVWRYAERFKLYLKVSPGITGLWQVSGRNDTTYEERVNLDAYYVRNWSVWLDIYIMARTIWVVIVGDGAY